MKILMVDDEALVRESMRLLLELDGHEMQEADSGKEALDHLGQKRFDLVFTDFFMPGMKGDELAREVHERNEDTPVVMVTGYPPNPPPSEVAKVVLKPFDLATLRSVLSQFCPVRQ
jgi:CheY-like chemotaxis protein